MIPKEHVLERIVAGGIIPVVRAPSAELAARAVDCLIAGGIDVVEITMTVPAAVEVIRAVAGRYANSVVVGAGTVLDSESARTCVAAGAAFIVSPATDEDTIATCRSKGVAILPGALTPTEIVRAARAGGDLIKVFPCGALGGAKYIKSLKAPLPELRLVPTGGVSEDSLGDYVRAGASAVGMGSELVDIAKIREGRSEAVVEAAKRCREAIRRAREPEPPAPR